MTRTTYSLRELQQSKKIYWISSYPTLKKWVEKDMKKWNLLKPMVTGRGKSKRYILQEHNVRNFIRAFENNQLA